MSSYDKIIKSVLEEIHQDTATLRSVAQNQEVLIVQNKKIIEILDQIRGALGKRAGE